MNDARHIDATMPHVLIVDDDTRIRDLLASFLRRHGFRITTAASAEQARARMDVMRFDAMVLDIMMPGEDGLSLTTDLRRRHRDMPILLLSALGEAPDRIAGLAAGSDDYVAKPFEPEELLLRLRALLRRATPGAPSAPSRDDGWLRLGEFHLNRQTGELRDGGELIALSSREREILRLLARTPNAPVAREDLLAPGGNQQTRSVDVEIARLRRKIEPDPARPRYIRTVRGQGYMLAAFAPGTTPPETT